MTAGIQKIGASGMAVFIEGTNKGLDTIREHCTNKKIVIMAVAIHRAFDIAENYAGRHAPECLDDIKHLRTKLISQRISNAEKIKPAARHFPVE